MSSPEDRHLRLVAEDGEFLTGADIPASCVACDEPAAIRSAINGDPLCSSCFRASHWHPSWSAEFEIPAE